MFCQAGFDQGRTTIMPHRSPLSKPQATVLALWSFGGWGWRARVP